LRSPFGFLPTLTAAAVTVIAAALLLVARAADAPKAAAPTEASASSPRAALTVTLVQPQPAEWPLTIAANGSVAAWQEASVGAEIAGLRLETVRVNVGDTVRRGQVLASFATESVRADLAEAEARVAEAEAAAAEAAANAERARGLQATGALSAQQIQQYQTGERTAQARLAAQRAAAQVQRLRLKHAEVLAPDDGVISARSATVGAVTTSGQELFRMIRQGRLEWRAEVQSAELSRLKPGMTVRITLAGSAASGDAAGASISGKLRMVAPTVNPSTRDGLVYVDLPAGSAARAGMFARGEFVLGQQRALTLPQGAVQLRDGQACVMQLTDGAKVREVKVSLGRRVGDRVEITGGLAAEARVVANGVGFLSDGDTVRVITEPPQATPGQSVNAPAAR
jgi:RND family efflux transporter MFP subunit